MTAVTWLAVTVMSMEFSDWFLPYQAFSPRTSIPTPIGALRSPLQHSAAGGDADGRHRAHDQNDQDERSGPRLLVPIVIGRNGVGKNLQRERRGGLIQFQVPKLISKGGKQQGGGFSRHPGKRQHAAGDHSSGRRAQRDREGGAPLGNAQSIGGLTHHVGGDAGRIV